MVMRYSMVLKKAIAAFLLSLPLLNQLNTLSAEVLECTVLFDATKAFRKVLHNGIYNKLLEKGAPVNFIRLLQRWYGHLQCRVKWINMLGGVSPVTCGCDWEGSFHLICLLLTSMT